jgi:hypothetical protein
MPVLSLIFSGSWVLPEKVLSASIARRFMNYAICMMNITRVGFPQADGRSTVGKTGPHKMRADTALGIGRLRLGPNVKNR